MKKYLPAIVVLTIIFFDQLTKYLVRANFLYGESLTLIPDFLSLTYVRNTGAAFGMLAYAPEQVRQLLFIVVPLIAVGWLVWLIYKSKSSTWLRYAYVLILSGAVGNLIDRIILGYVVDFADFYYQSTHFPAFNIADSAITIAAVMLLLEMLMDAKRKKSAANPS